MSNRQGNKMRVQLLLNKQMANLLEEMAAEQKLKPSAFMRRILYDWLKENADETRFWEAVQADRAGYNESDDVIAYFNSLKKD